MNWYKIAQQELENYFDIGHYNSNWGDNEPDKEERQVALWQSDIAGNHFQVKKFDLFADVMHGEEFPDINDTGNATMYQGRYDPIKNVVSVNMPVDPNMITRIVSSDDIPNRLIKQLERSFPGADIYAFEYGSPPKAIA
jgi:hypothetical protein